MNYNILSAAFFILLFTLPSYNAVANNTQQLLSKAAKASRAGDHEQSISIYEQYLNQTPTNKHIPHAYVGLIGNLVSTQQFDEAMGLVKEFEAQFPNDPLFAQVQQLKPIIEMSQKAGIGKSSKNQQLPTQTVTKPATVGVNKPPSAQGRKLFREASKAALRGQFDIAQGLLDKIKSIDNSIAMLRMVDNEEKKLAIYRQNAARKNPALAQTNAKQSQPSTQRSVSKVDATSVNLDKYKLNTDSKSYQYEIVNEQVTRNSAYYNILVHFSSFEDLLKHADQLDNIIKADLQSRSQSVGGARLTRLQGSYTFLVDKIKIENRQYERLVNTGWLPVVRNQRTVSAKNEELFPLIDRALKFAKTGNEKAIKEVFFVGIENPNVTIPDSFKFTKTSESIGNTQRYDNKRKVMMNIFYMEVSVELENVSTLIQYSDKLRDIATTDLFARIDGKPFYDGVNVGYTFKTKEFGVTYSLSKDSDYGVRLRTTNADKLEKLAQAKDNEFIDELGMTKAAFIAKAEGDKKSLDQYIAKQVIAKTANLNYQDIGKSLTQTQRLPIIYNQESKVYFSTNLMTRQEIVRKLIDKTPFPFSNPLSAQQIDQKVNQIDGFIGRLSSVTNEIRNDFPKGQFGESQIGIDLQIALADQVLYPDVIALQGQIIDLLASIPRTEAGFKQATRIYKWLDLEESGFTRSWQQIFRKSGSSRWRHSPSCEAMVSPAADNVGGNKELGVCFSEIAFNLALIRDVWRVQYMREVDELMTKKAKKEGIELNLETFRLAFGNSRFGQFGLKKMDKSPPEYTSVCIYDDCSSNITQLYLSAVGSKEISDEQKQRYYSNLVAQSDALSERWETSGQLSKTALLSLQTDTVDYARDKAPRILKLLIEDAINTLHKVPSKNVSEFNKWDLKVAKPLRQQIRAWSQLWEAAFFVTDDDRMVMSFGFDIDNYSSSGLSALLESPYNNIAESLFDKQYAWISNSSKGTVDDLTIPQSTALAWASGQQTSPSYVKPPAMHGRLMSPMEITFSRMGQQLGEGLSGMMQIGGNIKQLDINVRAARQAFIACQPSCSQGNGSKSKHQRLVFSDMLYKKDLFYLENAYSGSKNHGSIGRITLGSGSLMALITGEGSSFLMVDDGIPIICRGYFGDWVEKYTKESGDGSVESVMAPFVALDKMLQGNLTAFSDMAKKKMTDQRRAFTSAREEYGKYQMCRDQAEFDQL